MTAALDRVLAHARGVLARRTDDVEVLLDVQSGLYYSLNDVGARMWELCDGEHSLAAVIAVMAEEFDAPSHVIGTDVGDLAAELLDEGLLVEAS